MRWTLGIDPGVVSGWALLDPTGTPVAHGAVGQPGSAGWRCDTRGILDALERCSAAPSGSIVAVESQFLPWDAGQADRHRAHGVSALLTARIAGMWLALAEAAGYQPYEHHGEPAIPPGVWRSATWKVGRMTSAQAKRTAVELAASTWGVRLTWSRHHTAEAMWIASYAQRQDAVQGLKQRP